MLSLLVLPPWLGAYVFFRGRTVDWREAALSASLIWGVLVVALTEILSLVHALSFFSLLLSWITISGMSAGFMIHRWGRDPACLSVSPSLLQGLRSAPVLMMGGTAVILLATLIVAIVSPPNNWDSMTYHLARVLNWIEHGSVQHYPTDILRQLWPGPGAEFLVTQLHILSRGDRFDACVQYASMLGSLTAVSLIAAKFAADCLGQWFAAVFCVSVPMGVLQASSTQNDYVATFWMLCALNLLVTEVASSGQTLSPGFAGLLGAAFGLAALAKLTTLIFAAPFFLYAAIRLLQRVRLRILPPLALAVAVAYSVNAGAFLRNYQMFGSPLGESSDVRSVTNAVHTPAAIASNLIRNVAVELALPVGSPAIKAAILKFHRLTGMDVSDPRTTFAQLPFDLAWSYHEDFAGNPLHLLLAGLAVAAMLSGRYRHRLALTYSLALLFGFTIFCAYLKWQPWVTRLHLPAIVAMAPVCGLVFSSSSLRKTLPFVSLALLAVGTLYALRNSSRPLLSKRASILFRSRADLYFANQPALRDQFEKAALEVDRSSPSLVGLMSGPEGWEYPLRLLIQWHADAEVHFAYYDVLNESRNSIGPYHRLPEKIVALEPIHRAEPSGYRVTYRSGALRVFERIDQP